VFKASLAETKVKMDILSGASIGGINAAIIAGRIKNLIKEDESKIKQALRKMGGL
jgi:predicted acylesterase/phospholipase RssA